MPGKRAQDKQSLGGYFPAEMVGWVKDEADRTGSTVTGILAEAIDGLRTQREGRGRQPRMAVHGGRHIDATANIPRSRHEKENER